MTTDDEIEVAARLMLALAADLEFDGNLWGAEDCQKAAALLRTIPALNAKLAKAVEALDFLIDLKDYKAAHGKDDYYLLRQETAWAQARSTLAELGVTQEPAQPPASA